MGNSLRRMKMACKIGLMSVYKDHITPVAINLTRVYLKKVTAVKVSFSLPIGHLKNKFVRKSGFGCVFHMAKWCGLSCI